MAALTIVPTLRTDMPFWTLCVLYVALRATCWFCESVRFGLDSSHLFAPRRVTLKDQSNQNPRSVSGPTSSGSFALSLIRGSLQRAIAVKSPLSINYRATLRV
ncbi:hypothetical protein RYA07_10560, partial [Pseudomonas syringae pv. actinidiae]|nr:hypothetical protein [Pseudomonas syringae pv. actinidiae]